MLHGSVIITADDQVGHGVSPWSSQPGSHDFRAPWRPPSMPAGGGRCDEGGRSLMGDMMGAGIGNWILWWIFLGIAMVAAAGVVAARAPAPGARPGSPWFHRPNRQPCKRPRMPCGIGTPTARSAGRSTCTARSNWKVDRSPMSLRISPVLLDLADARTLLVDSPDPRQVAARDGAAGPAGGWVAALEADAEYTCAIRPIRPARG